MTRLPFSRKTRDMDNTRSLSFLGSRRASSFFSRREGPSEPSEHSHGVAGPGDTARDSPPQIYLGGLSNPSSSQSSMISFWEPAWPESSEYDEYTNSNTLDADSGRRLQMLQTSMSNPELSPSVRSILATAYRQFEKQSARTSEVLPPYSHDCKPPPYSVQQ